MRATAGFRDMRDEAEALVALLDPDRPAPDLVLGFKRGHHPRLRYGLFGAGVFSADEEPGVAIFAVARPGEQGARILRDGLGLFGACRMLSSEDGARRTHGRTDAGLAVLALAGPVQVAEDAFWRTVYGFAYSHAAHRGVLDVLLHRMRTRLGEAGTIARSDGSLCLELRQAIAVADPLCSPPAAARILSALARQPLATADSIAGRLGITVRAAQMALHDLVSDGACVVRRSGRQILYQLEDSTFSEPTNRDALRPNG
jgi:DNA-binding transcriptional ArsR family regulator